MLLLQLLLNGLVAGVMYALVAIGLSLIYNTTRVFHFAHGAIYTAGAYLCYATFVSLGWPLLFAVTLTALGTAAFGIALELLVYAPLHRNSSSPTVGLISSLGAYIVLVNAIALLFGNETKILQPGVQATVHLGPLILARIQVVQLIAGIVLLGLVLVLLRVTMLGKRIRAVRDNAALAEVMGVSVASVRLVVFALGSGLAGCASVLAALDVGMDPHVGMPILLIAAVAMIIGGLDSFEGAVTGGLFLGLLQGLVVWKVSARWLEAVTFVLLIVVLVFRPQGLLAQRRRLEEVAR
jgi:branched-chain amino acid transport system permease protein